MDTLVLSLDGGEERVKEETHKQTLLPSLVLHGGQRVVTGECKNSRANKKKKPSILPRRICSTTKPTPHSTVLPSWTFRHKNDVSCI